MPGVVCRGIKIQALQGNEQGNLRSQLMVKDAGAKLGAPLIEDPSHVRYEYAMEVGTYVEVEAFTPKKIISINSFGVLSSLSFRA